MNITFWGCRGSIPVSDMRMIRYGGNTTSVEVSDEDTVIIIDAGTGIRRLGEELIKRKQHDIHLLITHSHWDHIQGFPFFPPVYLDHTHITIFGCTNSYKRFKDIFTHQMSSEYFPIQFEDLKATITFDDSVCPNKAIHIGKFTIMPIQTNHPIYTLGFRIEHGNDSFVFITDNELCNPTPTVSFEQFADFCNNATYLVHDAQFTHAEYAKRKGWGHSTFEQVLALGTAAHVKNLGFTHHDPTREDIKLAAIEDFLLKQAYPFTVFAAKEQQTITI